MATVNTISSEVLCDLELLSASVAAGLPLDPVVVRRVQERAASARQDILDQFGVQDIGVSLIREAREVRH